jgi:hypothetical protein
MIHTKLLQFQKLGVTLKKEGVNPHFNSSYVTLNEVLDKVKKPLNNMGILILQNPESNGLRTTLLDTEDDTKIESFMPYVEISTAQKLGSNNTYLRRYALVTMLGLEDEDDDGNKASAEVPAYVRKGATVTKVEDTNVPTCAHGPMKLNTTKKAGANFGRQFYSCPMPMGKQCENVFVWADELTNRQPVIDEDGDEVVNKELAGL